MCRQNLRPGEWLKDLHDLSARGVPDGRIAAELSRRHGRPFTRRQVIYWRTAPLRDDPDDVPLTVSDAPRTKPPWWESWMPACWLAGTGKPVVTRRRAATAAECRDWQTRRYQVLTGWGHLLPGEERVGDGRVRLTDGHELRPRECDILSLLRDLGPLTARQLAGLCGLSRRRPLLWGGDALAGLVRAGLVTTTGGRHRGLALVYCLTESALQTPALSG